MAFNASAPNGSNGDATSASSATPNSLQAPSETIVNRTAHPFNKTEFDSMLSRRFFYAPAFEIYGGVAGLYDYGPPGSALQANILDAWRKHFIIEEDMLELDTTIMTVDEVLKTSGHVDKFTDWMVRDLKSGDIFRADHLVEAVLEARLKGDKEARGVVENITAEEAAAKEEEKKKKKKKTVKSAAIKLDDDVVKEFDFILTQIDNYTGKDLGDIIKKHNIVNPETGNELSEPVEFNLMFESSIGPTGQVKGYLRPETAQGHFVNFGRLLEFNNGRVPFASAQIGRSFRNEISPKQGLLRVREFTMAEIEHYVDPENKRHARFSEAADVKLALLPKDVQERGETSLTTMTVGEAVEKGIVDNQTLGYFLARVQLFLEKIGIDPKRLRTRQHMSNEMAHYAAEPLPQPKTYEKLLVQIQAKPFGIKFKKDAKTVREALEEMSQPDLEKVASQLKNGVATVKTCAGDFEITSDLVAVEAKTVTEHTREFTPNVIEPSFGIGRILYSLLEHSYWARESDVARGVLSLPPLISPIKILLVPLSSNPAFDPVVTEVSAKLRKAGVALRVDASGASIGKRYARNDELGTPFGCTIDFASVSKHTMTLRERDTTDQLIGDIDDVVAVVGQLVHGQIDWHGATQKLEKYSGVQDV